MSPPEKLVFTIHDVVPHDEWSVVDAGLDEFNNKAAPLHEVQGLSCFAHMPSETVIGGAIGRTWGTCCELQQLWVDPLHRRRGIGRELMKHFEQRAQVRGCRTFYLETFSFQAPDFYRSLGYEVRLELKGFGQGNVRYTMVREYGAANAGD
jgi:ribosomal protein S18 acetylase RimI-like enzyme